MYKMGDKAFHCNFQYGFDRLESKVTRISIILKNRSERGCLWPLRGHFSCVNMKGESVYFFSTAPQVVSSKHSLSGFRECRECRPLLDLKLSDKNRSISDSELCRDVLMHIVLTYPRG